jgi:octaprenyl-diphosphate synthase
VLQLVTQNDLATSEARYLEVVTGKTAALFAAACEVGAVVADRPQSEAAALAEFGLHLGIAFQLVDDALDYTADQAVLGKTVGDDFREGKITLPVLLAYQAGNAGDRDFWHRTIEASDQNESDLDRALELIERSNAIRVTLERAREFATKAKAAVGGAFQNSALGQALRHVTDYTVDRVR